MKRALAALLVVVAAGCGEATWDADLDPEKALGNGTPFVQALEAHGCPDSVQAIDSETFTASWSRVRLNGLPFFVSRDASELGYLVRKNKVAAARTSAALSAGPRGGSGPLRASPLLGLVPLLGVICAWQLGRALREKARIAVRPLLAASAILLATTWGVERAGTTATGGGVTEGSLVGVLYQELGEPTSVVALPGDSGSLLVYRSVEKKHVVIAGSEVASVQAFLVQRGKLVAKSAKTTTLQAQYYLFPFYWTVERPLEPVIAWAVTLATLSLALACRKPRAPRVESPPVPTTST